MKEIKGNIWEADDDVVCITTNGVVRRGKIKSGSLVMGAGIAKEAAIRYPNIPRMWGKHVDMFGNIPSLTHCPKHDDFKWIASLPTKNNWRSKSSIDLIKRSAIILKDIIPQDLTVAIPRPGCSLGKLEWYEVKCVIEPILDDKFTVYNI